MIEKIGTALLALEAKINRNIPIPLVGFVLGFVGKSLIELWEESKKKKEELKKDSSSAETDDILNENHNSISQSTKIMSNSDQNNQNHKEPELTEDEKQKIEEGLRLLENLEKITQNYQKELFEAQEEARKQKDPTTYELYKKITEDKFIENISTIEIPESKKDKIRKFIIGPISVGKSSIIKKFLNVENIKVGKGETTLEVERVLEIENIEIYDSPGINKDYDISKFENIVSFFGMNEFYVCYNTSLKNVKLILRILSAIASRNRQKIYLIRTQCDNFSEDDIRTLDEELEVDRMYLKDLKENKLIGDEYEILATSSRQPMNFRDNEKLLNLLCPQKEKIREEKNGDLMTF